MTEARAGLSLEAKFLCEMWDKDGNLIVRLFTLGNSSRLDEKYDALRITYCQRHRPPQVIANKYRSGSPWPRGVGLLWEIIKLRLRR